MNRGNENLSNTWERLS